jgi:RNA polymerase sigma factor (TIGR02999 family)
VAQTTTHVGRLLADWRSGDPRAADALFALVYGDLRAVARRQIGALRPGHTLAPTALVHEIYLRFAARSAPGALNRQHFLAIAARAMRHVVIDHLRRRRARKRDAATLDVGALRTESNDLSPEDLIAIDKALADLETLDPRQASIVEMRFFAGFELDEIAAALGISDRTVKRDWQKAKAFLIDALQ